MYAHTCKFCKVNFKFEKVSQIGGHVRNCKENPNRKLGFDKFVAVGKEKRKEKVKNNREKYQKNLKLCNFCKKRLGYKDRHKKFCNSSCAAKHNNTLRKGIKYELSEEGLKNSKRLRLEKKNKKPKKIKKCVVCNLIEVRGKYCSNCFKKVQSEAKKKLYRENPEKHPNRLCAGKSSYPEKMLKQFLIKNNLIDNFDFICQYKVEQYFVDFYFPKLNLCVEVDGKRWHQDKEKETKRESVIILKHEIIRFDADNLVKKKYEKQILEIIQKIKYLAA